jgi:hypothetical protein
LPSSSSPAATDDDGPGSGPTVDDAASRKDGSSFEERADELSLW